MRLDYTLKNAEDRRKLVEQIIKDTPPNQLTENYLEILSDYMVSPLTKTEKQRKDILTTNRLFTINKRETSYQELSDKLENGEDGLYNLSIEDDKNVLLTPKINISPKDRAEIPDLDDLKTAIENVKNQASRATGKRKFLLKKQLIEMCQEQYTIKNDMKQPIYITNAVKTFARADFAETITIDEETQLPKSNGICSFFNPKHLSSLLCNYSALKQES